MDKKPDISKKEGIRKSYTGMRLLKLKYWRERAGLKQEDLALLLGYKISNYSQKERGKVGFQLREAFLIRDAINKRIAKDGYSPLTIDDIFTD